MICDASWGHFFFQNCFFLYKFAGTSESCTCVVIESWCMAKEQRISKVSFSCCFVVVVVVVVVVQVVDGLRPTIYKRLDGLNKL